MIYEKIYNSIFISLKKLYFLIKFLLSINWSDGLNLQFKA